MAKAAAKVKVTYTKSAIGYKQDQKGTIQALGLKKLNQTVEHVDTPQFRGMVHKVRHLVTLHEATDGEAREEKA
ncbi:MAG: 50S ribosomal protein L30 [Candidatus Dormibacteria bacterium]